MTLYERLAQAKAAERTKEPDDTQELEMASPDAFGDLRRQIHQALLQALGPKLYDVRLKPEQLQAKVRQKLAEVAGDESTSISARDRQRLVAEISDDIMGYGPIEPLLQDPTVTEVMVNGHAMVYVERDGKLSRTLARFLDDDHLRRTIDKIVAAVGRRIDESQPYVDARLPDGSRVNAIIPPVSLAGPVLTIRKFAADPYGPDDLIGFGTLTPAAAAFLDACVRGRMNILVSGGTGVGKTTMLNVLSSFIPSDERIVTIEDAAELRLQQPHVIPLEQRPANIEGRGHVSIRDLVRNSLRMRPDRIVVGEVRGGEALDMLQAMNTGHDGSISTIHSNSPRDALSRLETMCLMAGMDLPLRAIRQQVAGAVQLIVHLGRLKDGGRRVTHITEVVGMEGDVVTLQDLYLTDKSGTLSATGLRPKFSDRLSAGGVRLESGLFEPGGSA